MARIRPPSLQGCLEPSPLAGWESGKALAGVEDPRLNEVAPRGTLPQMVHGSGQADPVQQFLLAIGLYFLRAQITPPRRPPVAELVIAGTIRLDVRPEIMMFLHQERVRPA